MKRRGDDEQLLWLAQLEYGIYGNHLGERQGCCLKVAGDNNSIK